MIVFIKYIIESSIILSLLTIFYALFLRKEVYFRLNRVFLLASIFISFIIPKLSFNAAFNNTISTQDIMQVVILNGENSIVEAVSSISFYFIALFLYILISAVFGLYLLFSLIKLKRVYETSQKTKMSNYTLVYLTKNSSPFSFFNFIFINKSELSEKEIEVIIEHEKIHSNKLHSLDIMLAYIVLSLMWFNPIIHLYLKYLKENHEFSVDNDIVSREYDIKNYINLITSQTNRALFSFSNQFNNSLTLKRLIMMKKSNLTRKAAYKFLFVIPLLFLSVFVFSNKNTEKITDADGQEKNVIEQKMPEFPGGMQALRMYIAKNVKYPKIAVKNKLEDIVYIQFTVDRDGKTGDFKVKKGKHEVLNNEALRVLKSMPDWKPTKGMKEEKYEFVIPVNFQLSK